MSVPDFLTEYRVYFFLFPQIWQLACGAATLA